MDIEKLIERLNNRASRPRLKVPGEAFTSTGVYTKDTLDKEAADALERLQIENQALRNSANGFKAENEKLRAELERVKAERDEAVERIIQWEKFDTYLLIHNILTPEKWRGPQKED